MFFIQKIPLCVVNQNIRIFLSCRNQRLFLFLNLSKGIRLAFQNKPQNGYLFLNQLEMNPELTVFP
jgi:hypothetical protein